MSIPPATCRSTRARHVVAANHVVAAYGQLAASDLRPFFSLADVAKRVSSCAYPAFRAKVVLIGRVFWVGRDILACMQFLEASNTVEILRSAGAEGMHVDDIARHIEGLNVGRPGNARVDPGELSEY